MNNNNKVHMQIAELLMELPETRQPYGIGEINNAIGKLSALINAEYLSTLQGYGQDADESVEQAATIGNIAACKLCEKAALEWFRAAMILAASDQDAALVLLHTKVKEYYTLAASHLFTEIKNHNQNKRLDPTICRKYLEFGSRSWAVAEFFNNGPVLKTKLLSFELINNTMSKSLGMEEAGFIFLNQVNKAVDFQLSPLLILTLYNFAMTNLKNSVKLSNPSSTVVDKHEKAVKGAWAAMVVVKDSVEAGQPKTYEYCLQLEKDLGHELEKIALKKQEKQALAHKITKKSNRAASTEGLEPVTPRPPTLIRRKP